MRLPRRWVWLLSGIALVAGLALFPARTREGLNFQVRERQIPLVVKGAEFLLRDLSYRRLATDVTSGLPRPGDRARRLFAWTRENIRPTPEGWPIRDDHIANIVIRGYGEEDQRADVFTTLATYAGLPAFWGTFRTSPDERGRLLSFVKLEGRWTVWDVAAGTGPEELSSDPAVLRSFAPPEVLRAEKQMPGPRLVFETRRAWRGALTRLTRR